MIKNMPYCNVNGWPLGSYSHKWEDTPEARFREFINYKLNHRK